MLISVQCKVTGMVPLIIDEKNAKERIKKLCVDCVAVFLLGRDRAEGTDASDS